MTRFNLLVSPRTQTVSKRLQREIGRRGGIIMQFDPVFEKVSPVVFNDIYPNRVLR